MQHDVIVIGSGISGLATAHWLEARGHSVLLLEKADRLGGAIRSWRSDGVLVEAGPNSTLETTPLLTQLIEEAGVADKKMYANDASKKRFILRGGALMPLPMSPPAFLSTKLFSWSAKLRLFREPFIAPAPPGAVESVAEFVERRLGREFLDYAINPFVAGVYAGDPALLDVRAAFPKLHEIEQTWGSLIKGQIKGARARKRSGEAPKTTARMFSFRDGMQTLTDAIAARLRAAHTGTEVERIARGDDGLWQVDVLRGGERQAYTARAVVIAAHAAGTSHLVRDLAPELVPVFGEMIYPPVSVVATVYRREDVGHPLDGFGFLIPAVEGRKMLGTIFTSTIFSDRVGEGRVLLTSFVGGMRQPELARQSDAAIGDLVQGEIAELLGARAPAEAVHVTTWERAIPQYTRGHLARIALVEAVEKKYPGLFFCANYRGGISVGDCVKSADRTVGVVDQFVRM